ncbi:MAG: hypothetical protein RIQ53_3580 [Pseudomonadota bacterium]|jgi:putative PEP-CTERM system TPR-repeat lipoprotein
MGASSHAGLLLAGLWLAGALGLSACDNRPGAATSAGPATHTTLDSARAALARGDLKTAEIHLKVLLQSQPDQAETRLLLGQLLLDSGRPAQAEVELRKAGAGALAPEQLALPLARALLAQGENAKLIAAYAGTTLPQPEPHAQLKILLAQARFNTGDRLGADQALEAALQSVPGHAAALRLRAGFLARDRQFARALEVNAQSLRSAASDAEGWLQRAELWDLSQPPASSPGAAEQLEAYRKALQLRPSLVRAHIGLITTLAARHDDAGRRVAIAAMRAAVPHDPRTQLIEAMEALQSGDIALATRLSDTLLLRDATDPEHMRLAAILALQRDDLARAEYLLANALSVTPGQAVLRRQLAVATLRASRPDEALLALGPLLADKAPDAETLALAALAQLQVHDAAQARTLSAAAQRQNPTDPATRQVLALVRLGLGDADGTAFAHLQALAATDASGRADLTLIDALLARRDLGRAAAAIETLAAKQPGAPQPPMLRGRLAELRGEAAAARAAYGMALARDPRHFPAVLALARMDVRERHPDTAAQRFDAWLQREPGHVPALLALADLLARQGGQTERITQLLSSAVRAAPRQADVSRQVVAHHLRHAQPRQAVSAARAGLAALPGHPALLEALGQAALAAGDPEQAAGAYKQLIAAQPRAPEPHVALARIQLARKDHGAAIANLQRAVSLRPGHGPAVETLVTAQLSARRPDDALATAKALQALRDEDPLGHALEGLVQRVRDRPEAAASAWRAALQRAPERTDLAIALHGDLLATDAAEARRFAADWLRRHPQDTGLRMHLGENALARADWPAARQQFNEVLQLRPRHAPALNNLAWISLQQRRPDALELAQRAAALAPDRPECLDTLAQALAAAGQQAQALQVQRRAIALQPGNPALTRTLERLQAASAPDARRTGPGEDPAR